MIATAIIMAVVFTAIFFIVQETVFRNLDNDLSYEAKKHIGEIKIFGDSIKFYNKAEWQEKEHREIQVNPVFIQLMDKKGRLMDKSPNLKGNYLSFKGSDSGVHFDALISDRAIRQVQLQITKKGEVQGYILAAMSSESAKSIIFRLRNVLFFSWIIVLGVLYFTSRLLAGRSIKPIKEVTRTITRITKQNLKERVTLPQNRDEIYELSIGFNALLERIESAIERERQFTSDASHELRTPLSSLLGTLEVLIRKPRSQEEYIEKIKYSLTEIERMNIIIDQLLQLARLDTLDNKINLIPLTSIIDNSLIHFDGQLKERDIDVQFDFDPKHKYLVPHYYTSIIIDNLLSNAIKYSHRLSKLIINVQMLNQHVVCTIKDEGIGIKEDDIQHIYDSFFRSDFLNHKQIQGNGLGLSLVKKCAEAIKANVSIKSQLEFGTTVTINFEEALV
jgi:signal transduction histidine kinase